MPRPIRDIQMEDLKKKLEQLSSNINSNTSGLTVSNIGSWKPIDIDGSIDRVEPAVIRSGYYQPYGIFDSIKAEELLEKGNLKELCEKLGLEVEKAVDLDNNIPYIGWILLKETRHYSEYRLANAAYIIKGIEELEDDVKIRAAIVEKPEEIQLYICPESIGTFWELDEFRELFINIYNKFIAEKIRRNLTSSPLGDDIDIGKLVSPMPWTCDSLKYTGAVDSIDDSIKNTLTCGDVLYSKKDNSLYYCDEQRNLNKFSSYASSTV